MDKFYLLVLIVAALQSLSILGGFIFLIVKKVTTSGSNVITRQEVIGIVKEILPKDEIITIIDKGQNKATSHLINTFNRLLVEMEERLNSKLRNDIEATRGEFLQELAKLEEKVSR